MCGEDVIGTRFLLKILWLFVVDKSVSLRPGNPYCKTFAGPNERTIRHRRQREGQRCRSFLFTQTETLQNLQTSLH